MHKTSEPGHKLTLRQPEPDNNVLVELGRVTWRAILLEGLVDSLCAFIRPANPREDRRSIGQKVSDARKVLRGWSESTARDDADAWLKRASAALNSRNGLLHATVGHNFGDDDEAVSMSHAAMLLLEPYLLRPDAPSTLRLGVMPRGSSPYTEWSMTPGALVAVAAELLDATDRWSDVLSAAHAERERQAREEGSADSGRWPSSPVSQRSPGT